MREIVIVSKIPWGKNLLSLATHSREVSHNLVCSCFILVSFIEDTYHVFGPKIISVINFVISDYQSIPKYVIPTFHPNAESWAELPAMRKSRRSFVFFVCEKTIDQ